MSQDILQNIYIAPGQRHNWVTHWNSAGWQGDTFVQPMPRNTGASMTYTDPSVSMSADNTYAFSYSVSNSGPNSTYYDLQLSKT